MSVVHLSIALQLMLPSVNTSNQVIKSTREFSWMEITNAVPTRPCPVFTLSQTQKRKTKDFHIEPSFLLKAAGSSPEHMLFFSLLISLNL